MRENAAGGIEVIGTLRWVNLFPNVDQDPGLSFIEKIQLKQCHIEPVIRIEMKPSDRNHILLVFDVSKPNLATPILNLCNDMPGSEDKPRRRAS